MKTINILPQKELEVLEEFGHDLLQKLNQISDVSTYFEVGSDLENILELNQNEEILLMYNPLTNSEGLELLTKNIDKLYNVKYLLTPYSSYTGLDLELLKSKGIKYKNNAGANAKAVAQFAITNMFNLLSQFPILSKLNSYPDGSVLGEELEGKTIGIIGLGRIGKELHSFFSKLGCNIKFFDKHEQPEFGQSSPFLEVLAQDILFIAIATNPETQALFEGWEGYLNSKSYVVDISGVDSLFDKERLVQMVEKKEIAGLAMEFHETVLFPAKENTNYIPTPHVAWCNKDAQRKKVRWYLENAINILSGEANNIQFLT